MIENFCKVPTPAKEFGQLRAKRYIGNTNFNLEFLNELKGEQGLKYVGALQMIEENQKSFWYLKAIDGETYRILEPADGIDELFDIEFKRRDVENKK
jgi:hypothetical protein